MEHKLDCNAIIEDVTNNRNIDMSNAITLINCIIHGNCNKTVNSECGDNYNVLDIVALVRNVLDNNPNPSYQIRKGLGR